MCYSTCYDSAKNIKKLYPDLIDNKRILRIVSPFGAPRESMLPHSFETCAPQVHTLSLQLHWNTAPSLPRLWGGQCHPCPESFRSAASRLEKDGGGANTLTRRSTRELLRSRCPRPSFLMGSSCATRGGRLAAL